MVGHIPGKGKYAGMLDALNVKAQSGQNFRLDPRVARARYLRI